jgi:tetratricopeptide (TPR) repeat protein
MRVRRGRVLVAALASLVGLSGCETSTKLGDLASTKFGDVFQSKKSDDPLTTASLPGGDPATTGSVDKGPGGGGPTAAPGLYGSDVYDELNTGKKFYRTGNYGLAERSFRRAVETHPRDAEAWLGLAASYDQLKRFDLADRAYEQTADIIGQTPELLNNRGFSYMLRGDYTRARATLLQAQAMDPANPYIQNNLELLAKSARKHKAIR